jgi:hypothetical protein
MLSLVAAALAAAPVCPAYTGLVPGATWRYRYTDAYTARTGKAGEITVRVESFSDEGIRVREDTRFTNAGKSYATTSVATLWCDADGLWLFEAESHAWPLPPKWRDLNEGPLREAALIRPAAIRVGQRWFFETGRRTRSEEVVGEAVVRVPAGTFETLVVRYGYDHGAAGTWYLDARVGVVASEERELVSYGVP